MGTKRSPKPADASGWRHDVSNSGGGLFLDVGSHTLDLIDFLVGPLQDVRGVASRAPDAVTTAPEDVVSASFLSAGGVVGTATWNFRANDNLEVLEIVGTRGSATLPEVMNGVTCTVQYNDGTATDT